MGHLRTLILTAVSLALTGGLALAGGQSFQIRTDGKVYQPGETIEVTFRYHVESGTPLVTASQSELGCHYFVWLETKQGDVVASAGGQFCDFFLECEEQRGPIIRTIDLPLPASLGCGIYKVHVETGYNLTTPDHPDGIGMGAESFLPVIICEENLTCSP